jgi:hypothetical protein
MRSIKRVSNFRRDSTMRNSHKTVRRERALPNYFKVLIHHPHLILRHRDPSIVSFAPIDYNKHNIITKQSGYDFKNVDDYIDFLSQHNVVKCVEKLSNNKIIFWINLLIDDEKNMADFKREIVWKWGAYEQCLPTTIDKANDFVTEKMFYMASNIICIEQVFYTHIKNKNSFYSPYIITFDC